MSRIGATLLLCAGIAGCAAKQEDWFVGTASMAQDSAVTLDIASRDKGGPIAHGHFVYRTTDKDYATIMEHVGPLQPGQTKPVAPWPSHQANEKGPGFPGPF